MHHADQSLRASHAPQPNLGAELESFAGSASEKALRFLPAPHSAPELAAMDARLNASAAPNVSTRARILVGTAVIVGAVTVPDISVGAMDAPFMQVELREPSNVLEQPIWSPSARSSAPVYASAIAAEAIAPSSLAFSSSNRLSDFDREMPLHFLENGSEAFDLAFAGVEMPSPLAFTVSRGLPSQPEGRVQASEQAIRTRVIDVPQIETAARFTPPLARNVRRAVPALEAGSQVERSVAVANEAVAAAFAGTLDVSADALTTLPETRAPRPATQDTARAIPVPTPETSLGSNAQAQAELVTKSRLDARINGVVTGSVDFRQLDGTIAIRLGSVVDLLQDRYRGSELDAIRGAGALGSYVTLAQLQAAGIPISYDPVYDEIEFGIDYQDAPNAAKVQVEQIGGSLPVADSVMIDQIPR